MRPDCWTLVTLSRAVALSIDRCQLRLPHEDSISTMILGGAMQVIHDFREYLRAYWVYVSTNLGLGKALAIGLIWVGGIFIPLGAKTFFQLPSWLMLAWMAG